MSRLEVRSQFFAWCFCASCCFHSSLVILLVSGKSLFCCTLCLKSGKDRAGSGERLPGPYLPHTMPAGVLSLLVASETTAVLGCRVPSHLQQGCIHPMCFQSGRANPVLSSLHQGRTYHLGLFLPATCGEKARPSVSKNMKLANKNR